MTTLTWNDWDSSRDASAALDAENKALGCPVLLANGYRMDAWDFVTKSAAQEKWGFARVKDGLDKGVVVLEAGTEARRTERVARPDDWV